jgi:uncharacterized membrane protein YkvA (DUF1232 family)
MRLTEIIRKWARQTKRDGVTLWFVFRHQQTSLAIKTLCALVVAYALSPIDLIPDFIPVLGYLDDVILLPVFIWITIRLVPRDLLLVCRQLADDWLKNKLKPRLAMGVLFVVVVWAAAAYGIWVWLSA